MKKTGPRTRLSLLAFCLQFKEFDSLTIFRFRMTFIRSSIADLKSAALVLHPLPGWQFHRL